MLIDLLDPPVDAIKGPAVGDVIYQEDPLCAPGVGPEDGAKPALARGVPEFQLDPPSIQQDGGRLIVDSCLKNELDKTSMQVSNQVGPRKGV